MPKCEVKRGFLILRECGNPTTRICSECGRGACDEHLVTSAGGDWVCVDCQGRQVDPAETRDDDPSLWRHSYRNHYYRSYGYAPYYAGAYYGSYYDDYDTRSFDREAAAPGDTPENDGGPDFMDS
jgi:hypothetical protein